MTNDPLSMSLQYAILAEIAFLMAFPLGGFMLFVAALFGVIALGAFVTAFLR